MFVSKTRFINWTRCPMYFPMDLIRNPLEKDDIDAERERLEEAIGELLGMIGSSEDDEEFDAGQSKELEALLPYYQQVEDEALKVANKYFSGKFIADCQGIQGQKLFEYVHNGHTYRCYVDIYNENDKEINIIEVKATTNSKYTTHLGKDGKLDGYWFSEKRGGMRIPMFVKDGNIWRLNKAMSMTSDEASKNFKEKKSKLLDRYDDLGKYPHDIAFQKFVIEHALQKAGDNRKVNYYLAVLNSEYVYDGAVDATGACVYNKVSDQEIITFFDMNEVAEEYQSTILREVATLESYIAHLHDTKCKVPVGEWCAWKKNTECIFWKHCYQKLRNVPDVNMANNYLSFRGFKLGNIQDKYQLINERYWKFDSIPEEWLDKENHKIQRECYDGKILEHVDKDKMQVWFDHLEYPIYHFDFETFPCPLPRFKGEHPYQQSCFEFSLHIERQPGVCDKQKDNFVFLNQECNTDEREALVKAIIDNFEFNEDGTLRGTMLAQNTGFEIGRLTELAELFPQYKDKLLAITKKSADLIHLLKTDGSEALNKKGRKIGLYEQWGFTLDRCNKINYYHKDLSGSYSIKKTLPVLVPTLSYDYMKKHTVGNGVQAYITYLNYDAPARTTRDMDTKAARRKGLRLYCQQDTWAMVEILRAIRSKIKSRRRISKACQIQKMSKKSSTFAPKFTKN